MAPSLLSAISSALTSPFPNIPKYSGPFSVGVHDIESSYPTKGAGLSVSSKDLASHGTVLVRLFYPAGPLTNNVSRARWLPHPYNEYASGYGALMKLPAWVSVPVFYAALLFTRVPAYANARFLTPQEAATVAADMSDADQSKVYSAETRAEIAAIAASKRYPVVVFSHGLAGCRTTYSSVCGELASHGYVVAAVEHRDGSAANTSYPVPPEGNDIVAFEASSDVSLATTGSVAKVTSRSRTRIHYRKLSAVDDEKAFRAAQLEHRMEEVRLAVRLLHGLDEGVNVREHDDQRTGEGDLEMSHLQGTLDLASNMFVAGHSFGAATALKSISNKDSPFKAAVALDPWMLTIAGINVHRPFIVMNSETFTEWKEHFNDVRAVVKNSPKGSLILTVLDSGHHHQSDFPALFPSFFKYIIKTRAIEPARALQLNTSAALQFLRRVRDLEVPPADGAERRFLGEDTKEVERWAEV